MVICRPSSYLFATNTEFQTAPIDPFFIIICLFARNRSFVVRISGSILPPVVAHRAGYLLYSELGYIYHNQSMPYLILHFVAFVAIFLYVFVCLE